MYAANSRKMMEGQAGHRGTLLRSPAQAGRTSAAGPRAAAAQQPSGRIAGAGTGMRVRRAEPEHPVVTFLAEIDMLQYADALLANGFDDLETLLEMEEEDMADVGMPRGHIIKFRRRLRELGNDETAPKQTQALQVARTTSITSQLQAPAADQLEAAPTTFTGQQVSSVQMSWEKVKLMGADAVGGMLYKNLFELAPEVIPLFPREVRARYQSWTVDEANGDGDIYNSPAMNALFGKVINAVGFSIAGMQDTEALVPKLRQLGMRHIGYAGNVITETHFALLKQALMRTLRACLGEVFTPEVEFAWAMVYQFIASIMFEGLREARAVAAQAKRDAGLFSSAGSTRSADGGSQSDGRESSEALA